MPSRTIFLVGAPTFSSLQWDENDLFKEPVYPFEGPNTRNETSQLYSDINPVKWRMLHGFAAPDTPLNVNPLGLTEGAKFFTVHDLAMSLGPQATGPEDSRLSQFYDRSFTIHETSEIFAPGALSGDSTLDSGLWTESIDTSIATNDEGEVSAVRPHIQGGVTNLQDIPNAEYLNSIVPQTMSVNLIVAIIAIRPPRRIVTRQWKRDLELVEVVVGDETKSGFGVTFWLPPSDDKADTRECGDVAGEHLRKSLMLLRPRDIVLLRTVGLSCFRDRVHGQSLRRGFTKIDLLHRQQVDATDTGGIYKLRDILNHAVKHDDLPLVKVRKVHEWIRRFVPDLAGGGRKTRRAETLPPDSQ
ncbi:hypothetical protein ASPVEDRAFT_84227 [Aspergillus versicolor CBS 583.65]|uniref:Uncharacterized protein n=1 Tax=Aspergillus versicolor CBS 583.65 TaxID=1036611 RepID=A0A1L9PMK7_ASPVE|nr:uncharacterized protein ASPVEDRAFT_84227 [Aspergillus versicolor CBS 583.65]OJJ02748.1 hypothetical protein ASPVEDRAFT_84227 [Aspergillus versicolor CBS 583.65]